jgi:hypothetical protein
VKWKNHQQLLNHIWYHRCLCRQLVQINPCVVASMVLMRIRYFWRGDELQLASRLDKHYITYLSQKQHLLVLGCARPFKVWPSSSCQHGLVGDAIANPSRILPLSKPWGPPSLL